MGQPKTVMNSDKEQLLTVRDILVWLNISRGTLYRLREDGLPAIKFGKSVRFDRKEVANWMKQNR